LSIIVGRVGINKNNEYKIESGYSVLNVVSYMQNYTIKKKAYSEIFEYELDILVNLALSIQKSLSFAKK
jgi:hypothetical protein